MGETLESEMNLSAFEYCWMAATEIAAEAGIDEIDTPDAFDEFEADHYRDPSCDAVHAAVARIVRTHRIT